MHLERNINILFRTTKKVNKWSHNENPYIVPTKILRIQSISFFQWLGGKNRKSISSHKFTNIIDHLGENSKLTTSALIIIKNIKKIPMTNTTFEFSLMVQIWKLMCIKFITINNIEFQFSISYKAEYLIPLQYANQADH